ncbi:hypothetical protein PGT21_008134 [Puccinia graminis f. sp. tritici]|uniref:C3H1-type domain-containing protein n=2 Tax=Puccinia graminis f. sp. tritici TaxID=56615 RepID=E3L8X9_PUCGT|nr:uncharacterized protein PGTG_19017 [Puccinia graminis f. sp. tritici CRL 75-36-700-3]EFP93004.1 hypothetical protein PGTG_19017 [Puccinia graminis f. sp. tritici CRL 75-36-700-3]KAA1083466.1 hypothetical protein PGTUg99_034295 [Puccinia graminis f. sp. tritici]KAA1094055.1 hypothetical protein PGT21_008134 [Puccinia graminis f. sp. tritici]
MTALQSPAMSVNTHLNQSQKHSTHLNDKLTTPLKQQAFPRTHRQLTPKTAASDQKTPPNQANKAYTTSNSAGTPSNNITNNNNPPLDGSKKSASKVSHVICKFFKAGNCSAGTTCQFSHTLPELGQGKPVCQWFVKGNCRFAHKCALAHILPGQPMSMDRKNKRAAQAAAREAAATSANQPSDAPFPASPPPELTLELVDDDNNNQSNSSSNQIINHPEPIQSIDSLSSPEIIHRSRQLLRSPRALLSDLDHEASNQGDDLQFGLPDDFVTAETSPPVRFGAAALSPSGHHSNGLFANPYQTNNSYPDQQQQPHHHYHDHRPSALSAAPQHNGFSSDRHQLQSSVERARAWPREQSPSPFGAGSPFSAPGSRSVFLPRIGSFGSEDGYPRSAPSVATSPNHVSHLTSMSHTANDEDLWDEVEVDGEEDVTELLPSSLHSLLTPAERHRQHIRKHAPHTLYSRSVPVEDIISSAKLKKQSEPSALRNGIAITNPLSVSPAPGFRHAASNETIHAHHHLSSQREPSNPTNLRPQLSNYLSSSYIQPTTPFANWEHGQALEQVGPPASQLSPPIALSAQKAFERSTMLGHAPGTSLPQGLAAGLSRLHFQPPLPTGLTPCGSPSANHRDHPLSPPRSPPTSNNKYPSTTASNNLPSFPLSQRMAGLNFGSTTVSHSSPLSRNVSCSPGPLSSLHSHHDDDDAPFRLEM